LHPKSVLPLFLNALLLFCNFIPSRPPSLPPHRSHWLRRLLDPDIAIFIAKPQFRDCWGRVLLPHRQGFRRPPPRYCCCGCSSSRLLAHLTGRFHPTGDILQNQPTMDKYKTLLLRVLDFCTIPMPSAAHRPVTSLIPCNPQPDCTLQ
jgi:hypothetical protein